MRSDGRGPLRPRAAMTTDRGMALLLVRYVVVAAAAALFLLGWSYAVWREEHPRR